MHWFKYFYLLLGLTLFAWLIVESDPGVVWSQVVSFGWVGLLVIVAIYALAFAGDTLSWQLTFTSVPLRWPWLGRLFVVRTIGEAFNNVIPAGSMGGEPVKALLLKRRYQVGYKESSATLVLAKTINLLGLVVFLCAGFALMLASQPIPVSLKVVAGTGLAVLSTGIILFFLVQRLKITSWLSERAGRWHFLAKVAEFVEHIRDIDEHFVEFYVRRRARFFLAVVLALANWLLGAVELYVMMFFLGHPLSIADAVMVESMAQLVRAGTFFIPASIGAQEGVFMLIIQLLTGSADLGLAVALVRRCRELVWITPGLLLAWVWSVRSDAVPTEETVEPRRVQ